MPLFAHYPAEPAAVRSQGQALLGVSRRVRAVGGQVRASTSAAAAQTAGSIASPVTALDRPMTADAEQLSAAGTVAGAALGLFADAVDGYNKGVDELNRVYERARAQDFFVDPASDGDETSSAPQRHSRHDALVAQARSALEAALRTREAKLMRDLDAAADEVASVLNGGNDTSSALSLAVMSGLSLFAGSDGEDGEYDDDDGGGVLDDLGGAFSDTVGAVSDELSTVRGLASEAGDEVLDRGTTLAQYQAETFERRLDSPAQTGWDVLSGTAALEDVSAAEGIFAEDGELYTDGEYCGEDAACLTGVSPLPTADATTSGHTIRFGSEYAPDPDLVEHEMQHVYDIEDVGGLGFYGSYAADYALRLARGESQNEAYENNPWERRGDYVQDNYKEVDPQGILSDGER